jgi:Secretion system C-terminal sorting domain
LFTLSTTWQEYLFTFTPSVSAAVLFNLDCGFDVAEFCFDDITFAKTSLLPVELIDYQLFETKKSVQLNWQVAAEINLKSYQIERSTDGQVFETMGEVVAKNFKNYSFEDVNVPNISTIYYRLRIINLDYTEGVSKILTLHRAGIFSKIKAFPNPVSDVLNLETTESIESIEAIDASGRIIKILFTPSGNGVVVSVENLKTGVFQLKISMKNGTSEQVSILKK